jgi:hypothetical protein
MTSRPALLLSAAALTSLLTACGSNSGNGDSVNTNDASSNPSCKLGTTDNGQCLSAAPYTPTASPVSPSPSATGSTEDRHHHHHHHHGKHHH